MPPPRAIFSIPQLSRETWDIIWLSGSEREGEKDKRMFEDGEPLCSPDPFLHRIPQQSFFPQLLSTYSPHLERQNPRLGGEIITQETAAWDGRYQLNATLFSSPITKVERGLLHVQSGGHAIMGIPPRISCCCRTRWRVLRLLASILPIA